MELMIDRPVPSIPQHVVEWPKVPQSGFRSVEVDKQLETDDQHKTSSRIQSAQERRVEDRPPLAEQKATQEFETINTKATHILSATEALKPQAAERRWLKLGRRFTLTKPSWPNPQLSLGTKCTRLGGNECWEATGPAQELFVQISKSLGDLLDARIDDLEEGEPVAGNILTFGMYMIGKGPDTARPTLLFTCQSRNPRRRAIKFVKESAILKGHPKIALAESSMCPLAAERRYLRLLSTLSIPSQGQRGLPNPMSKRNISTGEAVGLGVGLGLGVTSLIVSLFAFLFLRRHKSVRRIDANISSEIWGHPSLMAYPESSPPVLHPYRAPTTMHQVPQSPPNPWILQEISDSPHTIYEIGQSSAYPYTTHEMGQSSVYPYTMHEIYRPPDATEMRRRSSNSGRGTSSDIEPMTSRPGPGQGHTAKRGSWTGDAANRRRVAKVSLSFGNYFGTAGKDQFDNSKFKHGKALDFPEIPGEEHRNERLPQIREQYNQIRDADENVTPALCGSRSRAGSFSGSVASGFGVEGSLTTPRSASLSLPFSSPILPRRPHAATLPAGRPTFELQNLPQPAPTTVAATPGVLSGKPHELDATDPILGMPIERWKVAISLNQSQKDIQLGSDDSLPAHMYGTPIVCPLTGKRATIGGVIYLKGLYDNYLTVGHVFEGLFQSIAVNDMPVPLEHQDRDFEFSFAHEDEEEPDEIDVAAVTFTSQASVSSSASLSHTRTTNSTSSRTGNENQPSNIDTAVMCNEQHENTNITPTSPTKVMRPTESSISGSQLGLDWALIQLSQPTISNIGTNSRSRSLENVVLPRRVVPSLENEADIVVVTGYSGIVKGKISLSTTMMRLSQRSKFQEVWTVRLDNTLVEGDSGSWVLHAIRGDLYGHVVAGIPGSYIVYIIPAYKVFEDIKRVVGDTVELDFGLTP